MIDYAAKVAAGIKLLDSKKPGWRDLIEVDNLSLESCDVCVLGQVFGAYETGKYELDLDNYDTKELGFNTDYSYSELTQAWKDALGEDGLLVEKGHVYKDIYGYAVKVLQTHILKVDNQTITAYIVKKGEATRAGVFTPYDSKSVSSLLKADFETTYKIKVEKFTPKKGMFISGKSGKSYYMTSDDEVRELKDGAYSTWLKDMDKDERDSLKEMYTGIGKKFSDTIVK